MTVHAKASAAAHGPSRIGWIIASATAGALTGLLEATVFQFGATLVLQGFLVGVTQWFVMRGHIPRAWRWILATGLGLAPGHLIMASVNFPTDAMLIWLTENVGLWGVFWLNTLEMPLVLLPAVLLQAVVLRAHVSARRWIGISLIAALALGMAAATAGWFTSGDLMPGAPLAMRGMAPLAAGWTVYALITAPLLGIGGKTGGTGGPGAPQAECPAVDSHLFAAHN